MGRANSLVSSYKGTYPILTISSEPNHLPKVLYPNTIILGGGEEGLHIGILRRHNSIHSHALPHLTLDNPMTQGSIQAKEKEVWKINSAQGDSAGSWKFSNLRIFVLKTTEDFCCLMRLLRHYPFWFEAICLKVSVKACEAGM